MACTLRTTGRVHDDMLTDAAPMISRPLVRAVHPQPVIGQIGGHVKRGVKHPVGPRTGKKMALVSALPLGDGSDRMVLAFIDRSNPVATFDQHPHRGDNAVVIAERSEVHLSVINGVCPGDWKGVKIAYGEPIEEPLDLDVDPTGLDLAASDRWVDLADELGADCSKVGGYPLWTSVPVDVDALVGRPQRFHHRITGDIVDLHLSDGGVVYVFVDADGAGGSLLWQQAS
jgi:hypothetical protein